MKNVLIDNWSLENVVCELDNEDLLLQNATFHNILEALFLWDNVYFPKNVFSEYWNFLVGDSKIMDYLIPFIDNNEFDEESKYFYNKLQQCSQYTENVARGAIRYSLLSSKRGFDYLPCSQRSEFLEQTNINNIIYKSSEYPKIGRNNVPMPRMELWNTLDKEIKEFYEDFSKQYSNTYYEVELPVLANYIIYTKPEKMSYFEYARSLKNKFSAEILIKYIDKTEKEIAKGNFVANNIFLNDMKDIVDTICSKDRKLITLTTTRMFPTFTFSFDVMDFRKINFIFARKIVKYATKNK